MMIFSVRIKRWLRFFILFILFTLLFYQVISFLSTFFESDDLNDKPQDGAIRVFAKNETSASSFVEEVKTRLQVFYWLGE
ncbi:DUF4227 family protein [Thermoflavimicrobium dichotomicum]|uniref:Uncharacterized protein n=1 Tax=Thermoflavimicrobium dichotomicum TaxID=46223 RepID=A0A1I3Q6F5_9BACL|nr:DUF4227 family protein [Thermoflavimicrobium dichotomicum]SFJ28971.1 Protein of unknown function [Thermoflavimicrobium dichotomicum]